MKKLYSDLIYSSILYMCKYVIPSIRILALGSKVLILNA